MLQIYNLKEEKPNLMLEENRRFCYHDGVLLLGGDDVAITSHAAELYESGLETEKEPYDVWCRGWISGKAKGYSNGILHFAPNIVANEGNPIFEPATELLLLLEDLGLNNKTIIRGYPGAWEQRLGEIKF